MDRSLSACRPVETRKYSAARDGTACSEFVAATLIARLSVLAALSYGPRDFLLRFELRRKDDFEGLTQKCFDRIKPHR